ncbi:DUF1475 family protein [Prosthecobacter sp.]|uniref:DUF1475 family protein n=1 Tax=Prosthecobacter sp. TaxID=1965333 RepID=UPI003783B35A
MIWFFRVFFSIVLVSMLGVTSWASTQCALWALPGSVGSHPWFIATLFDTYWAFLTFYCWLAYKERSWLSRLGWLVGVLLLGNIAMAVYMLILLFCVPATARMEDILLRKA